MKLRVLLIGPLPPPEGGVRVTCRAFLDFVRGLPHLSIEHADLPIRRARAADPPSGVHHPRTIAGIVRAACRMRRVDALIIFGSPRFCYSYGMALVVWAKTLGRSAAVRIGGGRPHLAGARLPAPIRGALCAALRQADAVVVQTDVGRLEMPPALRAKTTTVRGFRPLPPSTPSDHRRGDQPDERRDGRTVFAWVGMAQVKGADVLLDAFDRVRAAPGMADRVALHCYGGGGTEATVRRAAATPGITVHGPLPNERLRAALPRHDVLVFPSRYVNEGHPGAIIEAFMAGLPVIGTDLPGPGEILEHEGNALIVPTGDRERLAAAMIRIASDHALRQRLVAGARASGGRFAQDLVLPEVAEALGLLPA